MRMPVSRPRSQLQIWPTVRSGIPGSRKYLHLQAAIARGLEYAPYA